MERKSVTESISTPTMAGGLFTVLKKTFYDLGAYDKQMEIWGGENIELSLRAWMCGGQLQIVPCSLIGHVFPEHGSYDRSSVLPNTIRAIEVWLDEPSKRIFYEQNSQMRRLIEKNQANLKNIHLRHNLKEKLKCRPFSWYLENIFPEFDDYNMSKETLYGQISYVNSDGALFCLSLDLFNTNLTNKYGDHAGMENY